MKRQILYIAPGPIYQPEAPLYQTQFERLSNSYSGYVYTTAPVRKTLQIGEFRFIALPSDNSKSALVRFVFFCISEAIKLRLKGSRVDIVSTYDPLKTGLIGLIVSRILNAKFIPEVNGVYTSKHQAADASGFLDRLKTACFPAIMRFVLRRADGIKLLFPGQLKPFGQMPKHQVVRAFPCFVPVEHFSNIREDKEILFAGFPFYLKGVDVLISAFRKIAPRHPAWKLKILGWFPDMTELNNAMDGHPQIYHHKAVHYQQMIEHIGTCGILVLPSRTEAMGRVLVEAMAAGKPRIGSNVDGIPTVIEHGVDGLLFESENVDDLAEKLDALMSSSELRRSLGDAGAVRAKKEFSKETYFQVLDAFYRAVLGRNQ